MLAVEPCNGHIYFTEMYKLVLTHAKAMGVLCLSSAVSILVTAFVVEVNAIAFRSKNNGHRIARVVTCPRGCRDGCLPPMSKCSGSCLAI